MHAPVQYATTDDGVRIAFATDGTGLPIVCMPPLPLRHVELEWQLPEDRRWLERFGEGRRLIRYDPRGLGLSERTAPDWSLAGFVRDVDAVVDASGTERVGLFAGVNSAPIAIAYAARRPERVSHLVLWCPVARMVDAFSPQLLTLLELAEKDWSLFTEAAAHQMVGWSAGEPAHRYADYLRACLTPEVGRAMVAGLATVDAIAEAAEVRVPTLVLHRRGVESVPVARAAELASRISGARLAILEGAHMRPGAGDIDEALRVIGEFLEDRAAAIPAPPVTSPELGDTHVFRREGDYWTLVFDGTVARIRDVKGLHHIAHLLRERGRQLVPRELLADLEPPPAGGVPSSDLMIGGLDDAGPVLDARAKAEYRERLADLRAELADAEDCNDLSRTDRTRAEIEAITGAITAAVGLGGRDRKLGAAAERARLTVTKRIKDALVRIGASHPALARHLAATIKTGQLCSYEGGTEHPSWVL